MRWRYNLVGGPGDGGGVLAAVVVVAERREEREEAWSVYIASDRVAKEVWTGKGREREREEKEDTKNTNQGKHTTIVTD